MASFKTSRRLTGNSALGKEAGADTGEEVMMCRQLGPGPSDSEALISSYCSRVSHCYGNRVSWGADKKSGAHR